MEDATIDAQRGTRVVLHRLSTQHLNGEQSEVTGADYAANLLLVTLAEGKAARVKPGNLYLVHDGAVV